MVSIPELRIAARLLKAQVLHRGGQLAAAQQEAAAAAAAIDAFGAALGDDLRAMFRAKPSIADVYEFQRQLSAA